MCRWLTWAALGVFGASLSAPAFAQSSAAPPLPAWQDQASVYLAMNQDAPPADDESEVEPAAIVTGPVAAEPPAVTDEVLSTAVAPEAGRRLAPPSHDWSMAAKPVTQNQAAPITAKNLPSFALPGSTIYKIASALAIVVGLFLLFAWLLRRGSRSALSTLPADVVCVLGRVPLAARQFAELLRVGNKLVLVALTPTGPTTLTEVVDAVEVDRLVGLCQQSDPHSTTKAFEQVFRQLAREPVPTGFLGDEARPATFSPAIDAFRVPRGDGPRA
jgi:flagellar biogenesis protein FliO